MGAKDTLAILEKVVEVATLAGIKGEVDDDMMAFITGFNLPEGRSQMVYVVDTSQDTDKKIITIYSPCRVFKKGIYGTIPENFSSNLFGGIISLF